MKANNYSKLPNGAFGAFVNMEFDGKMKTIESGVQIEVVTKNGERHIRTVDKLVKSFKSGCLVSLIPNSEIENKAKERFEAVKNSNQMSDKKEHSHNINKPCAKCGTYCYGDCEA